MTDHLPECYEPGATTFGQGCICDRLRACEQRVREDERCKHAIEVNEMRWQIGVTRDDSYAAALLAAAWLRDSQHHPSDEAAAWAYAYAEAIDALKEKP